MYPALTVLVDSKYSKQQTKISNGFVNEMACDNAALSKDWVDAEDEPAPN